MKAARTRTSRGGDGGFTLVEVIIAVVVAGMLTAGIAGAISTSLFASSSSTQKVRESNDAQLLTAFLVRDAQAAGGTDPAKAQADSTIGVSLTDAAGCAAPGTLVIRYSWKDRAADRSLVSKVASYGFTSATHQLVRRTCAAGVSQGDAVVGRQVASVVARCDGNVTCPNLPSTTLLTVVSTNAPQNGPTPYTYTVFAAVRPEAQTLPSGSNATEAPLIALGASGTCPALAFGGSAEVTVSGDVIVNAPGCANPLLFNGQAQSHYTSDGTYVLSPAYQPSSLIDPFYGTTPPAGSCSGTGNPAQVGGHYQPGVYHNAFTVPSGTQVFDQGQYVFCADVTISSNAEVSGTNVLWYFKQGTLNTNGQATMTISAATSGTWTNLLIWFDAANTTSALTINGGSSIGSYNGILYAPSVDVTLNGGAGTSTGGIIARSISFSGNVCAHLGTGSAITISGTLPNGNVGTAYLAQLTASGGTAPYTYSATGLPLGLDINPTSGQVFGTPTSPGTSTATITVVDDRCNGAIVTRSVTIGGAITPVSVASPATLPAGTVGAAYPATTFTAAGGTGPYTWAATGLPAWAQLSTGGVLTGTPTANGTSTVTVTATDALGATGTQTYALSVGTGAAITINAPASLPNATKNSSYPSQTFTATGGTGAYTWSATGLPNNLAINPTTGVLGGNVGNVNGTFTVVVTAADGTGSGTRTYSLVVGTPTAPTITAPASLPAGTRNVAYPTTTFTATGGTGTYTWTSTALPAGMSFSTAGALSGTPTATGTTSVTFTVTDAAGASANRTFNIVVNAPVAPTVSSPATLPNGTRGAAYATQSFAATSGTTPYTWSATGLPAGLTLSSAGVLSGTPTATCTCTVNVTVTDAIGSIGTKSYTLTVVQPTISVSAPAALPTWTRGRTYPTQTFTATGGSGVYTWSASGLPAGLTLSNAGVLTGTPTAAGTASVVVTATESGGATGTRTYAVTINNPPTIISPVSVKKNSKSWADVVVVSGGTGPFTFTGTPPNWITLTSAGAIATTGTQSPGSGGATFTVSFTDATGATTGSVSLTVNVS